MRLTKGMDYHISTLVVDNYLFSDYSIFDQHNYSFPIQYNKSNVNLGYGKGHNFNFDLIDDSKEYLFITLNPDVAFTPEGLNPLLDYAINNVERKRKSYFDTNLYKNVKVLNRNLRGEKRKMGNHKKSININF